MSPHRRINTDRQVSVARLSLGANVFLVAIKVLAGWQSGSLSVLAEGVQSFIDIFASVMIIVAVRAAAAPPDRAHPWGHGKFENLSGLVQTLMLLVSASGILYAALWRWHHPHMPQVDLGAAALIVSMCVNFLVARRVAKVAKQTESSALAAEAVHLRADLWSCTGVLSGLAVTRIWSNPRLDPACAAIMTMFALASAIHLLRDIARPLLDESLPAAEQAEIKRVLGEDPRVLGYHKLRTRRAGSTRLCDVHVMLADDLSFRAAHAITEEIEEEIRRALPNLDVIVHAEPFEDEMERERSRARARARGEY